jgi:transposase
MTTIDLVPDQHPRPILERNPAAAATRTTQAQGGRPRGADRVMAGATVFARRPACPGGCCLPRELGAGSPVTCWRRLHDWQQAGLWKHLHAALLNQLGRADEIEWSRVCLDSLSVRAKRGRRADRPQSDRPWQARLQAPSGRRPVGRPAGGRVVGGQHPRRAAAGSHDRYDPAGHGPRGRPGRPRQRPASCTRRRSTTPHCRRVLRRRASHPRSLRALCC